MADGLTVSIQGMRELDRKLKALDARVKRKIVRVAVRRGADIIKHQAKSNAATMVGGDMGSLLARHLSTKRFRRQKRGSYGVAVWMRPDVVDFVWVTQDGTREYIPAAIEFGHYGGWQQHNPSFVPAIPFIRTAFDSKVQASIRVIGHTLKMGIETGIG